MKRSGSKREREREREKKKKKEALALALVEEETEERRQANRIDSTRLFLIVMDSSSYVSKAWKTHVFIVLQTAVPLALQVAGLLPEEKEGARTKDLAEGLCFRDGRIRLACLVDMVKTNEVTLWTGLLLILTASSAVYAGSWRSVKNSKQKPEDKPVSMTKSDAMRFPIMGSCVLLGLFAAIKLLPKELLTLCLGLYFVLLGTFAIAATTLPFVECWMPKFMSAFKIKLGILDKLPKSVKLFLFDTDEDLDTLEITGSELLIGLASLAFCSWYHVTRHWVSNNVIGLSFCIQGIEMLSLGSVQVGMILLSGLFFYDIFWVFFTPVMVTVAKSFDAPIKLLFLRSLGDSGKPQFSMLGLGDIVIPGIYLALLLRMDQKRGFDKSNYFGFAFFSYCAGLVATLVVMNVFQHAQPALLYLVPACLGSTFLMALRKREVMLIFNWSEDEPSPKEKET